MAKISTGAAWELFAVMKDGELQAVVAKDPNRPAVIDITEDLARLLHHARSSPPGTEDMNKNRT